MYARTQLIRPFAGPRLFDRFRGPLSSRLARAGLFALVISMGLLYVIQMNLTATKGYEIRELERSVAALEKDAKMLKLQALELQSTERIVGQLPASDLVKARPDGFLNPTASEVAVR
ncbi:MAG: hypothetical protein HY461_00020 [Parcubacteria group bacterium]|nr:hypothetical protein [Parcubacteria group bacterium]